MLNCRLRGFDYYKPDLIIIDRNLKLKKKLKLFEISKKRKTYIFTSSNNKRKMSFFKKKNIKIIKINKLNNKNDFNNLFRTIYKIGKGRILLETGLTFLNKLIKFGFVSDLYIFKSNKLLKTNGYNNVTKSFIQNLKLKNKIQVNLDNDDLFKIRIK